MLIRMLKKTVDLQLMVSIFGQMTVPALYRKDAVRTGDTYVTTTPVGYKLMSTKRSLAPRPAGWLAVV